MARKDSAEAKKMDQHLVGTLPEAEDVEGHIRRSALEVEEDVEGHVQPPRDIDIER